MQRARVCRRFWGSCRPPQRLGSCPVPPRFSRVARKTKAPPNDSTRTQPTGASTTCAYRPTPHTLYYSCLYLVLLHLDFKLESPSPPSGIFQPRCGWDRGTPPPTHDPPLGLASQRLGSFAFTFTFTFVAFARDLDQPSCVALVHPHSAPSHSFCCTVLCFAGLCWAGKREVSVVETLVSLAAAAARTVPVTVSYRGSTPTFFLFYKTPLFPLACVPTQPEGQIKPVEIVYRTLALRRGCPLSWLFLSRTSPLHFSPAHSSSRGVTTSSVSPTKLHPVRPFGDRKITTKGRASRRRTRNLGKGRSRRSGSLCFRRLFVCHLFGTSRLHIPLVVQS